jgi:hypothetical protein
MGLDIHAASNLRYVGPIPQREEFDRLEEELNRQDKCLDEVYFLLFPNDPEWEDHLAGMKHGLYEYTAATEQHSFRAGPYSDYITPAGKKFTPARRASEGISALDSIPSLARRAGVGGSFVPG